MPIRSFQRAVSSLPEVFRFLDECLAQEPPGSEAMGEIRLAVDELFTNMVRHQPHGRHQIEVALECRDARIIIGLTDHDVEPFDPTTLPEPDLDAPAEARREGGLGIYLTRQLMTAVRYDYDERLRRSTVTMEKVLEA